MRRPEGRRRGRCVPAAAPRRGQQRDGHDGGAQHRHVPGPVGKPDPPEHPASDDDWVPPPHAVPFGPFLALAALEQLFVGALLVETWFGFMGRLWGS